MNAYTTHYGGYDFDCEAEDRKAAQVMAASHFNQMREFSRLRLKWEDMPTILVHSTQESHPIHPIARSALFE